MKMKNRVLAVLALALLMINIAPVRKAEAAVSCPPINELPFSNVSSWSSDVNGTDYLIVSSCVFSEGQEGFFFYFYDNMPEILVDDTGILVKHESRNHYYGYFALSGINEGKFVMVGAGSDPYAGEGYVHIFDGNLTLYGCNFPLPSDLSEYPQRNIEGYYQHEVPANYFSDAPYFTDVTYSNTNLFMIDGNIDFDASTFKFVFNIADDGREYVRRIAELSGYVYLPSKEFIDKAVEYYMGGRNTLDAYYSIYSCKEYPNWLKSIDLGDGSTYKKWGIKLDVECGNNLDLRLSHNQIYQLIEECNGIDLREYYGIDDIAFIDHILKGYMWVHRIDGYITTTYSDSVNYGNLTSFVMSTYLDKPVIVVGNSDPLFVGPMPPFVGPMLPDADVQQDINQAYKDALDQAMKENEDLNNTLDGYYDVDGAFGDLNGSDLWSGFKGVTNGISGLSSSVRSIAAAVGNVFAFFPGEITSLLYAGFIAMIVIAIIKAIRG